MLIFRGKESEQRSNIWVLNIKLEKTHFTVVDTKIYFYKFNLFFSLVWLKTLLKSEFSQSSFYMSDNLSTDHLIFLLLIYTFFTDHLSYWSFHLFYWPFNLFYWPLNNTPYFFLAYRLYLSYFYEYSFPTWLCKWQGQREHF